MTSHNGCHRCALVGSPASARSNWAPRSHVTGAFSRDRPTIRDPTLPKISADPPISKQEIEPTRELPSFQRRTNVPSAQPPTIPADANVARSLEFAEENRNRRTMFRAPIRRLRPALLPTAARAAIPRRAASTASGPAKKGTWKGAAARWAVAGGAVYWYCTSPIFADDPARAFPPCFPYLPLPPAGHEELRAGLAN